MHDDQSIAPTKRWHAVPIWAAWLAFAALMFRLAWIIGGGSI